jgi:hypothetical protein
MIARAMSTCVILIQVDHDCTLLSSQSFSCQKITKHLLYFFELGQVLSNNIHVHDLQLQSLRLGYFYSGAAQFNIQSKNFHPPARLITPYGSIVALMLWSLSTFPPYVSFYVVLKMRNSDILQHMTRSAHLQEQHRGLCRRFGVTLTPSYHRSTHRTTRGRGQMGRWRVNDRADMQTQPHVRKGPCQMPQGLSLGMHFCLQAKEALPEP